MDFDKLSEKEKGYLFGIFEGDGYKIYHKKSRHYHVEFYLNSVNDIKIIDFLVNLLRKIDLNPNIYQDKRCNCKRIRVYSKELFENICKGTSLNDKTKNFSLGFVSGLIDSEGHVNKNKSMIMIVNTDKSLLEKCKDFLENIGISSKISERKLYNKDKKISYRMYLSVKFKSTPHLSIKTQLLQI